MDVENSILHRKRLEYIRLTFVGEDHQPVVEVDGKFIVFTDCDIWPDKVTLIGRNLAPAKALSDRETLVMSHEDFAANRRLSSETKALIQRALAGELAQANGQKGRYLSRIAYGLTLTEFKKLYEMPEQSNESA